MSESITIPEAAEYGSIANITNAGFCKKARNFTYKTQDPNKPENYTRSVIIKDTIKAALHYKERSPQNIMEYMADRYEECMFRNYQQKRMYLLWDHRRVMRYLNEETRQPVFLKGKAVTLAGHTYMVRPDFCFTDEKAKSIEIVMMKIGKPDVTKRGRANAEIRDLRLYAMILYGRLLGYENIKASMYFLKKSSDTLNWASCQQTFFGGGGNVISMTDVWHGEPNSTDQAVEPYLHMLHDGVDPERMCEKDCDTCAEKGLCKYTLPPIRLQKEPLVKSAADIMLTPEQDRAVHYNHGIARINAGAGAGKTMVVAFHIRYLIQKGVKPEEICCMTFTNAGAKEMLHRAELYTGQKLEGMTISTFNAFENDIVTDCWKMLGFPRKPKVIDNVEKFGIIAELLNRHPIYEWTGNSFLNFTNTGSWMKGALQIAADVFSAIKRSGKDPSAMQTDEVRGDIGVSDISDAALYKLMQLYSLYDQELKQKGLIEFDDQEILAFRVFQMDPSYLASHYPFRHIIVDEFQDSSEGQIELIKLFRNLPTFESLMVIGDDSQAIFGFRNTTPEYIIHFDKYIGERVDDIYLVDNHRSTPEIIDFANRINSMNQNRVHKDLVATRPGGRPVIVNGFFNRTDEYRYIVTQIKADLERGRRPEEIAVIASTKTELQEIADLLTKEQIPSMFAAPEKMLENSRIRAIMAFYRVVEDGTDTKDALIAANAKNGGVLMDFPHHLIDEMMNAVLYEAEQIRNAPSLAEKKHRFFLFIDSISFGDETVEHFKETLDNKQFDEILTYCSDFARYGESTEYKRLEEYPGVVLVTAHSSKGLEWPCVYNTVSRYQKKVRMSSAEEEEIRRLLFVSATRARDELTITGQFEITGSSIGNPIYNRFLSDAGIAAGKPDGWMMEQG